mmetsp:Transcript_16258/g.33234  ORF Transcript_16258/g.33234 Transcript_16258/m.33234 type:complete len:99 (-) Transcript_16258:111-407(-)
MGMGTCLPKTGALSKRQYRQFGITASSNVSSRSCHGLGDRYAIVRGKPPCSPSIAKEKHGRNIPSTIISIADLASQSVQTSLRRESDVVDLASSLAFF